METLEAIRTKRAVREYTDQPVADEIIHEILHAGRRAQSSRNDQPWHFIVVRERETLAALAACGGYAKHVAESAFTIVIVSATAWMFDIGQAAAYLQLAAWDLGVSSCIASLQKGDEAKALLGIPQEQFLELAISFGYAANAPKARPGGRRPLGDVVRWEKW